MAVLMACGLGSLGCTTALIRRRAFSSVAWSDAGVGAGVGVVPSAGAMVEGQREVETERERQGKTERKGGGGTRKRPARGTRERRCKAE